MAELENTRLWKAFEAKANVDQNKMVRDLTRRAADRLDLVRDTFPTYTLHNRVHAFNVIELMGQLLGPEVEKLTPLEGAMLMLSAYCHDIGMVFDEAERRNIASEPDFSRFLKDHPEAAVRVGKSKTVPVDVAEAYCRWIHPDRVYSFLKRVPESELRWGGTPIHHKLGAVCRSHGYDVKELKDDVFQIDFRSEADLRFCAILLRLGDILDFDNTRTPEEVYKYLGLSKRDEPRKEVSDVEWRKHLALEGFRFPEDRSGSRYVLKVLASPDHPAVEYDVRQFLEVIESEFQQCRGLLVHCSEKWRSFRLPTEIDKSDIVSNGYTYGEYRFTLEQRRILELLMGENLYDSPFVFIRELLQNAIDTTRHRLYFERSRGNQDYRPEPIVVSTWLDEDSYQWVRIDDYGMGMNEEIIRKFFLKVGESYYRSAQFRAEMLGYERRGEAEFIPISRFGIGVLSCFIAGDRVEVSTRHAGGSNFEPNSIRLQLSGLHSFYVLQSERDMHYDAAPMPGPRHTSALADGYRPAEKFGTSVAVRLDPRKENKRLNLKKVLEDHVLCSPVPVVFEGEEVGGDTQLLIETPWVDGIVEEELTAEETAEIENFFGAKLEDKLKVRLIPLDLTAHSPTPSLRGQALTGHMVVSERDRVRLLGDRRLARGVRDTATISFQFDEGLPRLEVEYSISSEAERYRVEAAALRLRLAELSEGLDLWRDSADIYDSGKWEEKYKEEGWEEKNREYRNLEMQLYETERKGYEADRGRSMRIVLERVLEHINPYVKESYFRAGGERHWLSHNGVVVPVQYGNEEYESITISEGSGEGKFWLRKLIALSDALRPDISLSRDRLKSLTWNVYSAITLAFRKAVGSHGEVGLPLKSWEVFEEIVGQENFLLGTLLNDPLLALEDAWAAQEIIDTEGGKTSLERIRAELGGETTFTLTNLPDITAHLHNEYDSSSIPQTCAAALVQIGLNVTYFGEAYSGHYVVNSTEAPAISEGQKLFPPLFFAPYDSPQGLRRGNGPLNRLHPFAGWLIEHAVTIHEIYPGIFEAIRNGVSTPSYDLDEATVEELNDTLDRLWVLNERLRPGKKFRFKPKDFGK
jgi:hypothetical protein